NTVGLAWANTIEQELHDSDAVIPLLSGASVQSEMLAYELEMLDQINPGAQMLPLRVRYSGSLPETFARLVGPWEHVWDDENEVHRDESILWREEADTATVLKRIGERLDVAG